MARTEWVATEWILDDEPVADRSKVRSAILQLEMPENEKSKKEGAE